MENVAPLESTEERAYSVRLLVRKQCSSTAVGSLGDVLLCDTIPVTKVF